MRFKTGFMVGCAAGAWAASRAAGWHRTGEGSSGPAAFGSPAKAVSPEVTAEKVRAISDLAIQRINGLVDGPRRGAARQKVAEMLTSSLRHASSPNGATH